MDSGWYVQNTLLSPSEEKQDESPCPLGLQEVSEHPTPHPTDKEME